MPGVMARFTEKNLELELSALLSSGAVVTVTDPTLPATHWSITVNLV